MRWPSLLPGREPMLLRPLAGRPAGGHDRWEPPDLCSQLLVQHVRWGSRPREVAVAKQRQQQRQRC